MKKIFVLLVTVLLAFCLCGCDSDTLDEVDDAAVGSDGVLSEEEQINLYYDAVNKNNSMSYLKYDGSVSNVMMYSDEQLESTNTVQVKIIDAGTTDARYSVSCSDGDKVFDYYYLNGYVYSNKSTKMYKAPMSESEFGDYIGSQIYLAVGEKFTSVTALLNDDGTFTVEFNGMSSVPEALIERLESLNATEIELKDAYGEASVSDDGYLLKQSVVIIITMNVDGEAVTMEYHIDVSYDNLGQKFTITPPVEDECIEIDDIQAPQLIQNAYANILNRSHNASYKSNFDYKRNKTEYSMELDYNQKVSETKEGFEASDKTIIDYDTVSSGKTVKRSSEYKDGIQKIVNKKSSSKREMSDDSARNHYYQMLLDYEPDLETLSITSIKDKNHYYEIEYEYIEDGAILYCQNVLTTLIEDQDGIAVHSEEHTIESAVGTMLVSKDSGALISHEIIINAVFSDGDNSFSVGFEHLLRVYESAVLEVEDVEAKAGDNIEVEVYLRNNPGTAAIDVELDFDTDIFTATSVKTIDKLSDQGYFDSRFYDGDVKAEGMWFDVNNFAGNGKVMTFTFQVDENAAAGEYIISFVADKDDLVNEDHEYVDVTYLYGTVTIT